MNKSNTPIHIAMVTVFPERDDCIDGGVAGVSKYLADALKNIPDVKLTIVVPKGRKGKTVSEQWEDLEVYRAGKRGLWSYLPGTVYDIFAGKKQIGKILRQINPDIVHFQGTTFLAANYQMPNVLTIHGIAEKDAIQDNGRSIIGRLKWLLLKLTEDYGRNRAANVILISKYTRKYLPENHTIRKTWYIDNPVADSFFEIDRRPEPGRIFCCCRIRPLKNIIGMIKAFALIKKEFSQASLYIAGAADDDYLKECEKEIVSNNLGSSVHLLGNISIEAVKSQLSKANCLVLPSFQENSPLTITEAMAAGVPVVASRVGGIPEMIVDGKTGFLVDPYDTNDICRAVSKILSDNSLADSTGKLAKETARKKYMASSVAERTMKVYREILNGSS